MRIFIVLMLIAFNSVAADRSQTEKRHFAKAHPCPSNGKPVPSCPYYVIDHVYPLCAGGADKADNMQWQTKQAAAKKDVLEKRYCYCLKHTPATCIWSPQ